jgi:hypothetical protein
MRQQLPTTVSAPRTAPALDHEAQRWLRGVFGAQAVNRGGVIRRAARDVERIVGRDLFIAEVRRRGFHMVENAGQFIVLCNNEPMRVIC